MIKYKTSTNRGPAMMLKYIFTIILFFFSISIQAEVRNLNNSEFKKLMDQGIPVIDVRRPEEWKQTGIIKGSHMMTFFDKNGRYNLNNWMSELNKIAGPDKPFILICRSGNRTGQISQFLDKKLNYSKVSHVASGINNWISEGEHTVKP